jgi:hypothetical protein
MPTAGGQSGRQQSQWWLACALLATTVLVAPSLGFGLGYDQGILQYMGRTVVAGKWPYVDSLDNAFPGAILLHAAVLATGGTSVLALRIMDCLLMLATGGILYGMGRRLAGAAAGVYAASAYTLVYVAGGYYYTAQRDGFLVPFLLLALWIFWDYRANPSRRDLLALSGLAAGLACLIRPTYALVVVMGTVAVLAAPVGPPRSDRGRRRAAFIDAALFAGVAAAPLLLFFFLYIATGHGSAIVDLLQVLTTVYPSLERMPQARVLEQFVTLANRYVLVGAALSLLSTRSQFQRQEMRSLIGLLLGIVLVRVWEAKGYPYQYWPAFACLSLFAGVGWTWLGRRVAGWLRLEGGRAEWVTAAIIAAAVIAQHGRHGLVRYHGLAAAIRMNASDTAFSKMVGGDPEQASLAHYLVEHTTPTDSIQLWGAETMILVAANRWSATRFIDPFSFFCENGDGLRFETDCGPAWPKPVQVRFRRELAARLASQPPRYIIAHYANGTLAFIAGPDAAPDLPELRDLLDHRYTPEATFGNWTAFRRRGE